MLDNWDLGEGFWVCAFSDYSMGRNYVMKAALCDIY